MKNVNLPIFLLSLPSRRLYLGPLCLVFLATLASAQEVPAHLKEAAKDLSKSYTINYDETRNIVLNLPEGYLLRRVAQMGDDVVLCPWNEFFIIKSHRMPASGGAPVKDEASMNVELDGLLKVHEGQGGKVKERKVWTTPAGPLAGAEIWYQAEKKVSVVSQLIRPVDSELWLTALTGTESALADQKIIQNLSVEELSK